MKTRRKQSNAAKLARATRRVERAVRVLHEAMDHYETENPNWRAQALYWLLDGCLYSLQHYVESPKVPHVTWEHPFVELHYPVEWNWDYDPEDERATPQVTYGHLRSDEVTTKAKTVKAISRVLAESVTQTMLRQFTHDVALEKRGNHYTPLLPLETGEALRAIRGAKARQRALEQLYQPFSMGAAGVDLPDGEPGEPLSAAAKKELAAATRNMVPGFVATITVNGNTLKFHLVFQAHQLIVDMKRKQAYYPLTVGFLLVPPTTDAEEASRLIDAPWMNPENWSASDRRDFWVKLRELLAEVAKSFATPKPTAMETALLSVSVNLEVPLDPGNPDASSQAVARMLKHFAKTGKIQSMKHTWSASAEIRAHLADLLQAVEKASGPTAKGRTLEALVSALLQTVPGFESQSNIRTQTEEIDMVVMNKSEEPLWRSSPVILCECKNWSSTCGKNEVVIFRTKMQNRRGQCQVGFMISWKGFATTAAEELRRSSKEPTIVATLTGTDLRTAVAAGAFLPTLQAAWQRAVLD